MPSQLGLVAARTAYGLAVAMGATAPNGGVGGGVTVQYSNRSGPFITLLGRTWLSNVFRDLVQTLPSNETRRNFELAYQVSRDGSKTQFPPVLGIYSEDQIQWNGYIWRIDKFIDVGGYQTLFWCDCVRTQPVMVV